MFSIPASPHFILDTKHKYKGITLSEVKQQQRFLSKLYNNQFANSRESFYSVALDIKNRIIDCLLIASSELSYVDIPMKKIEQQILATNCDKLFITHNHPSGINLPSPNDIDLTTCVEKICKNKNIELKDHIIYCGDKYYSFKEYGRIIS